MGLPYDGTGVGPTLAAPRRRPLAGLCAVCLVPSAGAGRALPVGVYGNTARFDRLTGQHTDSGLAFIGWDQGRTWGKPYDYFLTTLGARPHIALQAERPGRRRDQPEANRSRRRRRASPRPRAGDLRLRQACAPAPTRRDEQLEEFLQRLYPARPVAWGRLYDGLVPARLSAHLHRHARRQRDGDERAGCEPCECRAWARTSPPIPTRS